MLSIKSKWFQQLPSRSNFLPLYEDERQNDVTVPKIPPPIVSSSVASFARETSTWSAAEKGTLPASGWLPSTQSDWFVLIDRREKQLQQQLQSLLDAQADTLLAGLGSASIDDGASEGSITPTTRSMRRDGAVPVRQPIPRKVGLRGARKGLYNTVNELAALKAEQSQCLEDEIVEKQDVVRRIEEWEAKGEGLRKEITDIEHSQYGSVVQALEQEVKSVQQEIHTLEARVSELKSRFRALTHQLSIVENSVQSQLSSYKASLSLLDSQIQDFLTSPVLHMGPSAVHQSHFMALSPKRPSQKQLEDTRVEREALEEGAIVWQDVVSTVTGFEKRLRHSLGSPVRNPADASVKEHADLMTMTAAPVGDMISALHRTIVEVENKHKLAEARNWKLLVCCIGAELEALKRGREILEDAIEAAVDGQHSDPTAATSDGTYTHDFASGTSDRRSPQLDAERRFESDEEPDPELLLSHQDTDTE